MCALYVSPFLCGSFFVCACDLLRCEDFTIGMWNRRSWLTIIDCGPDVAGSDGCWAQSPVHADRYHEAGAPVRAVALGIAVLRLARAIHAGPADVHRSMDFGFVLRLCLLYLFVCFIPGNRIKTIRHIFYLSEFNR